MTDHLSAYGPHDEHGRPLPAPTPPSSGALPPFPTAPRHPMAAGPTETPIAVASYPTQPVPAPPAPAPAPLTATGGAGAGWPPPPYGPAPGWTPGGGHWMPPPAPSGPAPRATHRLRTVATASVAAVVVLGAGVVIGRVSHGNSGSTFPSLSSGQSVAPTTPSNGGSSSAPTPPTSNSNGNSNGNSNSGSSVASKVDAGLVDINTTLGYQNGQAAGTGMVLTSSGLVLTNNHVINGSTSLKATDISNGQTYSATVVGYDRTQDIAVVQLQHASGLQTVSIGDSSNVSVGDSVDGIGNAGGTGGTPSDAAGSVTALNQSITASDEGDGTSEQLTGLIQTNANIEPGDSGGPLVNSDGQVIGIDTAASSGTNFSSDSNTGFAIPIDHAVSVARQITAGQASSTVHIGPTAFLGVEVEADSGNSSSSNSPGGLGGSSGLGGSDGLGGSGFNDPSFGDNGSGDGSSNNGSGDNGSQSTTGATVAGVLSGGSADQAGLAQGDVIVSLGGHSITSPTSLTSVMEQQQPGNTVTLGWVDQSGQSHSASIVLKSGPPS